MKLLTMCSACDGTGVVWIEQNPRWPSGNNPAGEWDSCALCDGTGKDAR